MSPSVGDRCAGNRRQPVSAATGVSSFFSISSACGSRPTNSVRTGWSASSLPDRPSRPGFGMAAVAGPSLRLLVEHHRAEGKGDGHSPRRASRSTRRGQAGPLAAASCSGRGAGLGPWRRGYLGAVLSPAGVGVGRGRPGRQTVSQPSPSLVAAWPWGGITIVCMQAIMLFPPAPQFFSAPLSIRMYRVCNERNAPTPE